MEERLLTLSARAPFRLDLTAWALRRDPRNRVDRWDGRVYGRVLVLEGRVVAARVSREGTPDLPSVRVALRARRAWPGLERAAASGLGRILGLGADLSACRPLAQGAGRLAALARGFEGLKPPRFPSLFEALVNGMACQQISLAAGLTLLGRLCERFGRELEGERAFPEPRDLARGSLPELRAMGFSARKADHVLGLARAVSSGRLDLEALAGLSDEAAAERLQDIPGVGRWTAEYALLRGLGRLRVFPADDVGARGRLSAWYGRPLEYDAVRRLLKGWEPCAGMMYFYLLLGHLRERGLLEEGAAAEPALSAAGAPR